MWRREDELARITGKWMQWDLLGGTCCWPDSVSTQFFLSAFFSSVECEWSFSLCLFSPVFSSPDWWQHFLVVSVVVPIIEMDQPVFSHLSFFSSLAFTESFVFSRLGRFSFFSFVFCFFFSSQTLLCTHQSIPFEFFFLSLSILLSMSPTSHKKTRARANAVDERPKRARE